MINRPQDYAAIKHLIPVAFGWAVAAILEAACYIQLALAIIEQQSPQKVLSIAAITILTTILASRSGFWAGARLANALQCIRHDHATSETLLVYTECQDTTHRNCLSEYSWLYEYSGTSISGIYSCTAYSALHYLWHRIDRWHATGTDVG